MSSNPSPFKSETIGLPSAPPLFDEMEKTSGVQFKLYETRKPENKEMTMTRADTRRGEDWRGLERAHGGRVSREHRERVCVCLQRGSYERKQASRGRKDQKNGWMEYGVSNEEIR